MKRMRFCAKRHAVIMFFCVLFAALAACNAPSFNDPPRSDHLSLLYFFHQVSAAPGGWLHVMNWDPWTQARYYPLAFLIPYAEFLFFGSNAFAVHLAHFAVYCCFLVLLYRMAMLVRPGMKAAALVFIGVYAFLYSHADLVSWAFHTYILAGMSLCLCGFFAYRRYMKTGRAAMLAVSAGSFLAGMLCYETFVFWPAGVIFLAGIRRFYGSRKPASPVRWTACACFIAVVYALYAAGWFFTRSIQTYPSALIDARSLFGFSVLVKSAACSLFALVHNGVFLNMLPIIGFPPRFDDQVFELAGVFPFYAQHFRLVASAGAALGCLAVALCVLRSRCRDSRDGTLMFLFLLYLFMSERMVLFATRSMTNPWLFIFVQFRYQFIPSALVGLMALAVLPRRAWTGTLAARAAAAVFACAFAANAYCSFHSWMHVHRGLAPLRRMLARISVAIKDGTVSETNRLFMDDSVVRYLPAVCWNERMGSVFMKGTYQWIFDRQQVRVFAFKQSEAAYIVDPQSRRIIENDGYTRAP